MNRSTKHWSVIWCGAIVWAGILNVNGFRPSFQVKQSPEVVEAYRLCETFEHVLGESLDFDRAYEATFPRNKALRRAIAISEGGVEERELALIDDELLIKTYKGQMQIMYFTFLLAGPSDEEEKALFFPAEIEELLRRNLHDQPPKDPQGFRNYASQMDHDVARFRAHIDRLSAGYPSVADRVRKFKSAALAVKFQPPTNYKVEPRYGYYRPGVLGKDVPFYEISGYSVAKEQGQMRIIGIKFFNRLF